MHPLTLDTLRTLICENDAVGPMRHLVTASCDQPGHAGRQAGGEHHRAGHENERVLQRLADPFQGIVEAVEVDRAERLQRHCPPMTRVQWPEATSA